MKANHSVHPRGCGERVSSLSCYSPFVGSSPRVRGTVCRQKPFARSGRFIPAGAGNGFGAGAYCAFGCGSSPRVRGTDHLLAPGQKLRRFIPAGAGNGDFRIQKRAVIPVHPRGCGERLARHTPPSSSDGSSPRVRGTAKQSTPAHTGHRFIPAGAGNGLKLLVADLMSSVHPRGCGERNKTRISCSH